MILTDKEIMRQVAELVKTLKLDETQANYVSILVQQAYLKGWKKGIVSAAETYKEVIHGQH